MQIRQGCILFLLCLPVLSYAAHMENIRGLRYCEVLVSQGRLNLAVYNTMGLNQCPEAQWKKITARVVRRTMHARIGITNGPRYWTMDTLDSKPVTDLDKAKIKGLALRKVAIVHLKLGDLIKGHKPYHKHSVERDVVWTYKAGKPVYELIDPEGHVYVMQSYSLNKASQTSDSLSQLGKKLKLPEGWRYRTGVLTQDKALPCVKKRAIVIQDDLLNTYQLASYDFLK